MCIAGARWVQKQLLEKYPDANLRVYAIWFSMLAMDDRSRWPADLLNDRRVLHRWDEEKALGRWYAARADAIRPKVTPGSRLNDGPLWDAYLLYDAEARWNDSASGLLHVGRTIVDGRETLESEFQRLFGARRR